LFDLKLVLIYANKRAMLDQKKLVNFLIIWVVNTIILLIFSAIFLNSVVLGNDKLAKPMAAVLSGLLITVVLYIVPSILEKLEFKIKDEKIVMGAYFAASCVGIWIIKRFAIISGLGVSNILWVLILAAAVTAAYWKVKMLLPLVYKRFLKS